MERTGKDSASTDLGHIWRSVAEEVYKQLFLENCSQIVLGKEHYRTTIILARCKMVEGEYVLYKILSQALFMVQQFLYASPYA